LGAIILETINIPSGYQGGYPKDFYNNHGFLMVKESFFDIVIHLYNLLKKIAC
jgi:hypothetical protein